jgi:hypothetical protein
MRHAQEVGFFVGFANTVIITVIITAILALPHIIAGKFGVHFFGVGVSS